MTILRTLSFAACLTPMTLCAEFQHSGMSTSLSFCRQSYQIDGHLIFAEGAVSTVAAQDAISVEAMIQRFEQRFGEAHLSEGNKFVAERLYPEHAEQPTLAVLRLRAGLSQRALADKMGVKQPHVARLEKEPTKMNYETMDRMARALGVDVTTVAAAIQRSQAESRNA